MWKIKYLMECAILLFFVSSYCFADSAKPQFLSGFYLSKSSDPETLPLILTSKDKGQSWEMVKNIPVIAHGVSQDLYGIDCTDTTCIAGGVQYNPTSQHVLMRSDDLGKNWTYINSITGLPHARVSIIEHVKCFDAVCFAYGEFEPPNTAKSWPLLLRSNDKGLSWTSINDIKNAPAHINSDAINRLQCEGNHCVGLYNAFKENTYRDDRPIYSTDKGQTWTYVKDITDLPENQELGIAGITCKGKLCHAIGDYKPVNDSADILTKPIILRSQDGGQHWQAIVNFIDVPDAKYGTINTIAFNNHLWIAAGELSASGNYKEIKSVILTSKDQGKHWEYLKNMPAELKQHGINALTCEKDYCVAAGYFVDPTTVTNNIPLFVSTDHGNSFKAISRIENCPPLKDPLVREIQCKKSSCIAYGVSDQNPPETYSAFVLNSQDKGRHWTYVPLKEMPKDLVNISIEGMSK